MIGKYGIGGKKAEILQVIDKFGILTRKQILEYVDISYKNLVYGLQWLEKNELIKQYKEQKEYLAFITKQGSTLVGLNQFPYPTDKKNKDEPSKGRLRHSIMVNNAIIQIRNEFREDTSIKNIRIKSERDLRADWYLEQDFSKQIKKNKKLKNRQYFPDFEIVINQNGEDIRIAGEVELSRKNTRKLIAKLMWYRHWLTAKHTDYIALISSRYYDKIMYFYDLESVRKHVYLNAFRVEILDDIIFKEME